MASEWYYTSNGQQSQTPVSDAQLKQLAASGQLQPTDLIWKDGMANWMPANSIKGLFPAGRSATTGSGDQQAAVVEAPSVGKGKGKRKAKADSDAEVSTSTGVLGMHPILVLVCTICTLGLFGLFYAYKVCTTYSSLLTRSTDSAGRQVGKARHPLAVLLLGNLTLGIYSIYWRYKVMSECLDYVGRTDINPRIELALMLIFPPYSIYVSVFRLPDLIRAVQTKAKMPESSFNQALIFLIPCLVPALPLLSMSLQDALNEVWFQAA